ncbi:MAG: sulfite reductase flavoprotein alpha-component [Chthoniobacter sp.]|jgi:sulfite reductase (NADPH) flavoprotein alpha-component|nr:sulfite reductase flavoprotein alpha-component [Chthoniobacter sp.]
MSTEAATVYSHKNPFQALHPVNVKLSGAGSEKDTRHHEVSLEDSGLSYLPGDALGLVPRNCPLLVEELIVALKATGDETVPGKDGSPKPLRQALLTDYALTFADKKFVEACARQGVEPLIDLLKPENSDALKVYLGGRNQSRDHVDILREFPQVRFTPAEFVLLLRKLIPRLYSIASSFKAHPDSVHLTVATVRFAAHGRERKGVASTFLAERWAEETRAGIFLQSQQKHFGMPADHETPMIMVGPGTGVAPFRAFLEERLAIGAKGKNWLFFGEQRRGQDFLYEEQFTRWAQDGILRLDTAFSRDQEQKIYVQDRMRENEKEIWAWIDAGAEFFVCGDKLRMATDVDNELKRIIEVAGGKTPEQAQEYVETMRKTKRYKRDVY